MGGKGKTAGKTPNVAPLLSLSMYWTHRDGRLQHGADGLQRLRWGGEGRVEGGECYVMASFCFSSRSSKRRERKRRMKRRGA